ncbi:hypothetical protein MKW94_017619 [Papaver nudicaule]|uniref:F-box/LRR-repeat protein 15-like leucin rich repeat domain-containing protein n=1 Tax=Papaver nudicaule TaxID=74823 RepID=A0AA41W012_PAPNU|nr:hypothetical protein [Papaver nudicaule]
MMIKIPTSKILHERAKDENYYERPCKISKSSYSITNLPGDCLNLIFKCLKARDDRNSFGLTCHDWLCIQNINQKSFHYARRYLYGKLDKYPEISPEIICNLLIRFQRLERLSLGRLPRLTDVLALKSQSFGSNVRSLFLDYRPDDSYEYSDEELSSIFSWFPRLTNITLDSSDITDKGLEALAKCCSSLKSVRLQWCHSITDSGIRFLLQNCQELCSLDIECCISITGIGFIGCAQTLTLVKAGGCNLQPEGIRAIVSGGGLKALNLQTPDELTEFKEGCIINTEAVMTISKGCPLLEELYLSNCEEVELEGWEAIGLNCKELDYLHVMGCQKLCDLGLQAICDGCNKLSTLYVDGDKNSCSSSILEHFERKLPGVVFFYP